MLENIDCQEALGLELVTSRLLAKASRCVLARSFRQTQAAEIELVDQCQLRLHEFNVVSLTELVCGRVALIKSRFVLVSALESLLSRQSSFVI